MKSREKGLTTYTGRPPRKGLVLFRDSMLKGARTTQRAAGRDPGGRVEKSL